MFVENVTMWVSSPISCDSLATSGFIQTFFLFEGLRLKSTLNSDLYSSNFSVFRSKTNETPSLFNIDRIILSGGVTISPKLSNDKQLENYISYLSNNFVNENSYTELQLDTKIQSGKNSINTETHVNVVEKSNEEENSFVMRDKIEDMTVDKKVIY